jgi:hypothetical protein
MKSNKRVAILMGSGASIPAGILSTRDITRRILDEFSFDGLHGKMDEYKATYKVIMMVRDDIIKYKLLDEDGFIRKSYEPNYEDIYYFIEQIADHLLLQTENPIVGYYFKHIQKDIDKFRKLAKTYSDYPNYLSSVCKNIKNEVIKSINIQSAKLDYLLVFTGLLTNLSDKIDIFTLNHDLIIEELFQKHNIEYCEGFLRANNNDLFWNPSVYDETLYNLRLFKLHGSIDWILNKDNLNNERYKIIPKTEIYKEDPCLLIGTFNKILKYQGGIFRDLFFQFYKNLYKSNNLIVIGYSFGDQGINSVIIDWFTKEKTLIIITPCRNNLFNNARGAAIGMLLENNNRIKYIESNIENVSVKDFEDTLNITLSNSINNI